MNCYVCATREEERPAVALCQHCLVGLCQTHLAEAQQPGPGGLQLGCRHGLVTSTGPFSSAPGTTRRRAVR